jgi:hypothetical protein
LRVGTLAEFATITPVKWCKLDKKVEIQEKGGLSHAQQPRKENIHHMDFVELSGDSAILGWNVSVTKKVAD